LMVTREPSIASWLQKWDTSVIWVNRAPSRSPTSGALASAVGPPPSESPASAASRASWNVFSSSLMSSSVYDKSLKSLMSSAETPDSGQDSGAAPAPSTGS